jgi:cell wall-associated NlpC family hydrolase
MMILHIKTRTKCWILILSVFLFAGLLQHITPTKDTYAATKTGYATTGDLNMRAKASSSSTILKKFSKGSSMTVLSTSGSWYKVKSSGKTGYVYSKYVSFKKVSKTTGSQIVSYAKKFVGNPYKWGGTSLTKGADCSGFTQSVFKHFGISLPRTSSEQRSVGTKVSSLKNAKAGDLICYYGHVAIYMGNNKIVHASSAKTGIKISNNAAYRSIASIRRLV